jgi:hypothetical protein
MLFADGSAVDAGYGIDSMVKVSDKESVSPIAKRAQSTA